MPSQINIDRFLRSTFSHPFKLNAYERILLVMLASYAGKKDNCFPSHQSLSLDCGMSTDSIGRYAKLLEEKKLITISRVLGNNNFYQLNIPTIAPAADSAYRSQQLPANSDHHPPLIAISPPANSGTNNISNNINESTSENVDIYTDSTFSCHLSSQTICPHEEIIKLYHEILPMCTPIKRWTDSRRKLLKQRWLEDKKHQTLEWWRGYFEHVKKSKFLIGQVPGRDDRPAFLANLEWLVRPSNFTKVIEGFYNRGETNNE